MELCQFHTRIYGKAKTQLYIFEPTWDSFRPIKKVGWDGKKYSVDDQEYKLNLFSQHYGFESPEQKVRCRELAETLELGNAREFLNPVDFWKWAGMTEAVWFRDRPCVFLTECTPKDWRAYLSYLGSRPRTLRRPPQGRVTRRLVRRVSKE
jgi:hypothetical protein